jgi:dipeptide/tripeptide permease
MNMCCQIGGAVTASLTPYLAMRFGWKSAFLFAAMLVTAGGILWLFVDPGRRREATSLDSQNEQVHLVKDQRAGESLGCSRATQSSLQKQMVRIIHGKWDAFTTFVTWRRSFLVSILISSGKIRPNRS